MREPLTLSGVCQQSLSSSTETNSFFSPIHLRNMSESTLFYLLCCLPRRLTKRKTVLFSERSFPTIPTCTKKLAMAESETKLGFHEMDLDNRLVKVQGRHCSIGLPSIVGAKQFSCACVLACTYELTNIL